LFFLSVALCASVTKPELLPVVKDNIYAAPWLFAFLFGSAFYINRKHIRLSIPLAVALLLATYPIKNQELGDIYILPALSYATICAALHSSVFFRAFTRIGDYSYGLYIYAFPLQQQFAFYHQGIHWLVGFALTYPIILGVAILSWHLIERPALALKKLSQYYPRANAIREHELTI
jgi:peptidoglycan/LPS O-acetylase OafA/YrhL